MLTPIYTKQFEKDLSSQKKRGKDIEKLKAVFEILVNEKNLPEKNKNHKLSGTYAGRWECHIESDWLLIYKIEGNDITFERTGTHSDLFR